MPYSGVSDARLPAAVKKLPKRAREAWVAAFNAAHRAKPKDEEYAFRIAWSAAKKASSNRR